MFSYRIARILAGQYPSMPDEGIYQRARHIVAAEMQNVVYGQYLEAVMGKNVSKKLLP